MGDLSDFERGQIVGARFTGVSLIKMLHYYVYREREFLRLCRSTQIMRKQHQRRGTVGEIQHWQKETVVYWEGLLWKSHTTTAEQVTVEMNIHLEHPVSIKPVDVSSTNPTSTVGLQLLNLRLLKVMQLKCVNDGVTIIKPGYQTTGNGRVIWSGESSFTLFATWGKVYVWRTLKEAYNPECLVPTVKNGGGSVMVWAAISWSSVVSLLP
jgi:hypothetical protein